MSEDHPEGEVPHLSPHIAKILLHRSPLHAWNAHRLGNNVKPEQTPAMLRGLLYDRLFFGVGPEIVPVDAADWRSKAAQEAKAEAVAGNKLPVLKGDLDPYSEAVAIWKDQIARLTGEDFSDGEAQKRIVWQSRGVPCKGFLDYFRYTDREIMIYDLKTCTDAATEKCTRTFVDLGYDLQWAAYTQGVRTLFPDWSGRIRMRFLFVETESPFAVNVVEPAGNMCVLGATKWRKAVDLWGRCLEEKDFPGYNRGIARIEAKPWQLEQAGIYDEGGVDGD